MRTDAALRAEPDPEAIHDARVAVRRLRSDLRSFLPLFDRDWAADFRERLRWLADGLGAARDLDVLIARLARDIERLPAADRALAASALAPLRAARDAAYRRVASMLDDPRYASLLGELVDALREPRLSVRAVEPWREVAADVLRDAWRPLRRAARRAGDDPDDALLHRVRIKAKRLRYAAEALVPLAGDGAARLAAAIEALQTVLGEQHDAVVARERLRRERFDARTAFVAGELAALEHGAASAGAGRWRGCWRRLRKRRRRLAAALGG